MEKKEYLINNSSLTIIFGDITTSDADIIVSSDDTDITMGGGVSGRILEVGGIEILNDAQKRLNAQLGDVIVSTAGKLSQKYIFHCITINYKNEQRLIPEDNGLQDYIIQHSVDKCLKMMSIVGLESIAFPTIGGGVAHFPLEKIATSMANTITEFLYSTNKHYKIEIYLYDRFHEKSFIDYTVVFENIATCINNHCFQQSDISKTTTIKQTPKQKISPPQASITMAALSPTDEHKVFVANSRKDAEIALQFCKQMDEMKISYWIDLNGKYSGNNFKEVIVDAIDSSQVILFLSSKQSNQSPYVVKEIGLAVASNKTIIPIKLDDSQYAKSIRFDLSDIDWIEYSSEQNDDAIKKFKYCLQLNLNQQ